MRDLEEKLVSELPKLKVEDLFPKEHLQAMAMVTSQVFEAQRKLSSQLAPVMEKLIRTQLDFSNQFRPAFEGLTRLINKMPNFEDLFNALEEFNQKLDETHRRDLLFLPPYFDDYTLPEIRDLLIDTDKPAMQIYFEVFSNENNLKRLIANWTEKAHFSEDRIKILSDAVEAHREKKYTLAIPALVGQLEGLLIESFGITQKQIREAVRKGFPKKSEEKGLSSHMKSSYIMHEILLNEVFNPNQKAGYAPNGVYPHRPTIQHGINTAYYKDQFASTRLIMLIDFISSETFQDGVKRYQDSRPQKLRLNAPDIVIE